MVRVVLPLCYSAFRTVIRELMLICVSVQCHHAHRPHLALLVVWNSSCLFSFNLVPLFKLMMILCVHVIDHLSIFVLFLNSFCQGVKFPPFNPILHLDSVPHNPVYFLPYFPACFPSASQVLSHLCLLEICQLLFQYSEQAVFSTMNGK